MAKNHPERNEKQWYLVNNPHSQEEKTIHSVIDIKIDAIMNILECFVNGLNIIKEEIDSINEELANVRQSCNDHSKNALGETENG